MRDCIVQASMNEKHPEKVDIFDLCEKLGDIDTEHYWCYLKNKVAQDLFSTEDAEEFVGVFTKDQLGYKLADKTVPYPTENELAELLGDVTYKDGIYLEVPLETLKKSKWQLLAEAYINAQQ